MDPQEGAAAGVANGSAAPLSVTDRKPSDSTREEAEEDARGRLRPVLFFRKVAEGRDEEDEEDDDGSGTALSEAPAHETPSFFFMPNNRFPPYMMGTLEFL